jgi:peptidoglycan-associated lipoprotein
MGARCLVRGMFCMSVIVIAAAGCADKPVVKPPVEPPVAQTTRTTAAPRPDPPATKAIGVSDDIAKACSITFGNVDKAPKFDTDQSDLPAQDRDILEQVAKCVTVGPLKGRQLKLVGRADQRGESEYNMSLGEHRADAVKRYLQGLGVPQGQIGETSRGKMDATGTDEAGWSKDRRVDLMLQ